MADTNKSTSTKRNDSAQLQYTYGVIRLVISFVLFSFIVLATSIFIKLALADSNEAVIIFVVLAILIGFFVFLIQEAVNCFVKCGEHLSKDK